MCAAIQQESSAVPVLGRDRDVRIIFSHNRAKVTYRGGSTEDGRVRGYIRRAGKVISGLVRLTSYNELVFYPQGQNEPLAYRPS